MAKMPQLPIEGLCGIARAAFPIDHETGAEPVICIYEVILAVRRVLFILTYVYRRNPPRKADNEAAAALGNRKFDTKSKAGNYADKALKNWAGTNGTYVTKVDDCLALTEILIRFHMFPSFRLFRKGLDGYKPSVLYP